MTPILAAQSLSMVVGGATLVDTIDLRIAAGEMVAIVGPNGAGKSTLLRMLSGDLRPTRGRIELKQREIHTYPPRQLAHHRAMLSQHVTVTFPFTVEEIVHMGAGDAGRAAAQRLVDAALGEVGLAHFSNRQLPTLSGGEQQRASRTRPGATRLRRSAARARPAVAGRADVQPRHAPPDRSGRDGAATGAERHRGGRGAA
jgi:iron complex transport system ATP-binding protein